MNPCQAAAAMQAWFLAIQHKLAVPTTPESVENLAQAYGKAITTPENIEAASHMFNWEHIIEMIEEQQ